MIKQLKHGQQRMLADLADRERGDVTSGTFDTLLTGLLHYEIPEAPNINKNIQTFVGVEPKMHNNKRKQRSKSAHVTSSKDSALLNDEEKERHHHRHTEAAYMNYVTSPRSTFTHIRESTTREKERPPIENEVRKTIQKAWGDAGNFVREDKFSLHNLLNNAKNFHLDNSKKFQLRKLEDRHQDKLLDLSIISQH